MKISVIIPYKNEPETAELAGRCLKSVMSQEFDIHYLVDFDGKGVSIMRNQGIESALKAGADYITFLDADDEYLPDAYEQICAAIREEPEEQIIQLNHYVEKDRERRARFFNRRGTYFLDNLPGLWVTVWNKVYKAELFEHIRFCEQMSYGEDELFNLHCLTKARRIYCSERFAVIHHKDNPNSLSKTATISDLMSEQEALCSVIRTASGFNDQELCEAVRKRQELLWSCAAYKRIFSEVHQDSITTSCKTETK